MATTDHDTPHLDLTNLPTTTAKDPAAPRRKARRGGPALDWAVGHGPVTGALSATTGAAAVALTGAATSMPSGWPLAIGAAGALGHGIGHSIRRRLTGRSLATRAASWLLAGGWTAWAIATGPLSWLALGTLATLGVGVGAMASHAAIHEEAAEEERLTEKARAAARALGAERERIAREWEERINRVSGVGLTVFAVERWASGAGFSIGADLPPGRATWDQIARTAGALAADARLPLGCTVHVEEGDRQGRVVLDIATENIFGGEHPYPADYSALSLLTGIPWGLLPTSATADVYLREACALILGPPGSGKSTFLDAVLAGFARCTDVVTWVIDLKGGAAGLPWVRPWLEATGRKQPKPGAVRPPEGTRPGVDWLASTPGEALTMLDAALCINTARQQQYQDLLEAHDTTLLPISSQLPQIEIVVDEGAELLSAAHFRNQTMKKVQELLLRGMRTTRAMGLRFVLTAVDGNVSALGDTSVRKFSPVGVALTSGESAGNNLVKLFPTSRIATSQLTAKGAGVIGAATADGFAPTPFKGWKTSPSMVRDVVLATSDRRPALDQVSAEAAGDAYATRWESDRAGWLWTNTNTNTTTPTAAAPDGPAEGAGTSTPAPADTAPDGGSTPGLNLSYKRQNPPSDGTDRNQTPDADALADRFMKEIDAQFGTTDEPHHEPPAPGLNLSCNRPAGAAEEEPDAQQAALMLLLAAGPDGTGASAIARQLSTQWGTSRQTVVGWLKAWVETGEAVRYGTGTKIRYVHRRYADGGPQQ